LVVILGLYIYYPFGYDKLKFFCILSIILKVLGCEMLAGIFERLDLWVAGENRLAGAQGFREIPKSEFRVVGQAALLEAKLNFSVAATVDVDILNNAKHEVVAKLREILISEGLELDSLSHQIWMPDETEYADLYQGEWVRAFLAGTEYIMLSKALKAPAKNAVLIRNYVAHQPSGSFFELCDKYSVDLKSILEDPR